MAVDTERRPAAVAPEPNGHRTAVRLHDEILPPRLDPSTPVSLRRARRALAILAVVAVVIQLISTPAGHWLNQEEPERVNAALLKFLGG